MSTLTQLIDKYDKIDFRQSVKDSFVETENDYINLNLRQMLHGLNSEGDKIGEYASDVYASAKARFNPLPGYGVVDLRLHGAFYNGAQARLNGNTIEILSVDSKDPKLEAKYGKVIWGLTSDSRAIYVGGAFWSVLRPKLGIFK
jgi:hypothetical protein